MLIYNTEQIRSYIENHKSEIESVTLGMEEDWFWTADAVYRDGQYLANLNADTVNIAGIIGSVWATPTMLVTFKSGHEKTICCAKLSIR